jgi:hypothetical protein
MGASSGELGVERICPKGNVVHDANRATFLLSMLFSPFMCQEGTIYSKDQKK